MGNIGSGKSTTADYLVRKHNFVERSFAEPLKRACQNIFLFDDDQVFGDYTNKEAGDARWYGVSPRTILQYVGTELFREGLQKIMPELGPNVFVRSFTLWYEQQLKLNPNITIVVSDVRFESEAECIKALGGIIIKISRDQVVDAKHAKNDDIRTHASEQEINILPYDYLLQNNNCDIEFLHMNIDKIIYEINIISK